MNMSPLITVIVCTYNRPRRLPHALASVLGQDFDDFEVVVVDDGSTKPVELTEISRNVQLIRIEHQGVGGARAAGLAAARGEFIAYCDDDDEWVPHHLSTLLDYLHHHPDVDLVYGDSEWADGDAAVPYSFDYDMLQLCGENYIFATDVMHRASAAREIGGFEPALQAYEDWDLWLRMSLRHLIRHVPLALARRHWHDQCVSAGDRWKDWDRVYRCHQERLQREAVCAQPQCIPCPPGITPFDRRTWSSGRKELIWHGLLRENDSYGSVGRQLIGAVIRRGIDVRMAPFGNQPELGFEPLYRPLDHWSRLAFYHDYRLRPSLLRSERIVVYHMWESTAVPKEQVEEINGAATLLCVPCRQNVETSLEAGVRIPIEVVHHGVDPRQFPYLTRQHPETFTFGTVGNLSPRKGIDVLLRAFSDEFSPEEPVRLLLKSLFREPVLDTIDARVVRRCGFIDHRALLECLREMDVFVLPSRGEGFGLCGLEAMSTGLPLIATDWSGPAEYLDPSFSFPLSYRLVDARGTEAHRTRFFGQWAEPDYEHLRYLMRWLYEHPGEAANLGQRASRAVRAHWTWKRAGEQLSRVLDSVASR